MTKASKRDLGPKRSLDDKLGEALRRMFVDEGQVKGAYSDLPEQAKEHWRARGGRLRKHATALGLDVNEHQTGET